MTTDDTRRDRQGETAAKDARQDRLKSALRENLKRRKSQIRERGRASAAECDRDEASPSGQVEKKPGDRL
jgi:hypothetical protein